MSELNNDIVINNYKELLINKQAKIITKLELGFVDNDCSILPFDILIHCLENIIIFDEDREKNIINFINKLSNE